MNSGLSRHESMYVSTNILQYSTYGLPMVFCKERVGICRYSTIPLVLCKERVGICRYSTTPMV